MAKDHHKLGHLLADRGDLVGAEASYRMALAIDEQRGHVEGVANAYANLGVLAELRRDIAKARRLWILSRDAFATIGMTQFAEEMQRQIDTLPPE